MSSTISSFFQAPPPKFSKRPPHPFRPVPLVPLARATSDTGCPILDRPGSKESYPLLSGNRSQDSKTSRIALTAIRFLRVLASSSNPIHMRVLCVEVSPHAVHPITNASLSTEACLSGSSRYSELEIRSFTPEQPDFEHSRIFNGGLRRDAPHLHACLVCSFAEARK